MITSTFLCDSCKNKGPVKGYEPKENFEIYCSIYGDMDRRYSCKKYEKI